MLTSCYFESNHQDEGINLSQIINPNVPGKERARLKKGIALALRELMKENEPNAQTRDLVAFISLALDGIKRTVEITAVAWEKRNYWLKADRFRREWAWADALSKEFRPLVLAKDWDSIALSSAKLYQHVKEIKISEKHRMGKPWIGAWEKLMSDVSD